MKVAMHYWHNWTLRWYEIQSWRRCRIRVNVKTEKDFLWQKQIKLFPNGNWIWQKGFIFEKLAAVALNDFSGQQHFPRLSENWSGSFWQVVLMISYLYQRSHPTPRIGLLAPLSALSRRSHRDSHPTPSVRRPLIGLSVVNHSIVIWNRLRQTQMVHTTSRPHPDRIQTTSRPHPGRIQTASRPHPDWNSQVQPGTAWHSLVQSGTA